MHFYNYQPRFSLDNPNYTFYLEELLKRAEGAGTGVGDQGQAPPSSGAPNDSAPPNQSSGAGTTTTIAPVPPTTTPVPPTTTPVPPTTTPIPEPSLKELEQAAQVTRTTVNSNLPRQSLSEQAKQQLQRDIGTYKDYSAVNAQGDSALRQDLLKLWRAKQNPELFQGDKKKEYEEAAQRVFQYGLFAYATDNFNSNDPEYVYRKYMAIRQIATQNQGTIDWEDFDYLFPQMKSFFAPRADLSQLQTKTEKYEEYLKLNDWLKDQRVPAWQKLMFMAGIPLALSGVVVAALGGKANMLTGLALALVGGGGAAASYFLGRKVEGERTLYTLPPVEEKTTTQNLFAKDTGLGFALGEDVYSQELESQRNAPPATWELSRWRDEATQKIDSLGTNQAKALARQAFTGIMQLQSIRDNYQEIIKNKNPALLDQINNLLNQAASGDIDYDNISRHAQDLIEQVRTLPNMQYRDREFKLLQANAALNLVPTGGTLAVNDALRAYVTQMITQSKNSDVVNGLISGNSALFQARNDNEVMDILTNDKEFQQIVYTTLDPNYYYDQVFYSSPDLALINWDQEANDNITRFKHLLLTPSSSNSGLKLDAATRAIIAKMLLNQFKTDTSGYTYRDSNESLAALELAQVLGGAELPDKLSPEAEVQKLRLAAYATEFGSMYAPASTKNPVEAIAAGIRAGDKNVINAVSNILRLYGADQPQNTLETIMKNNPSAAAIFALYIGSVNNADSPAHRSYYEYWFGYLDPVQSWEPRTILRAKGLYRLETRDIGAPLEQFINDLRATRGR